MNCVREDLKAHITDVLVGEAESALALEVKAHIETCASCRADREEMVRVLGLLKAAPPWVESAGAGAGSGSGSENDEADRLSVIQRQKIESLAARKSASSSAVRKKSSAIASWLAMAASVAGVGIALYLAQAVGRESAVEGPAPAQVSSSVHQLPQAPEGPMLPRSAAAEVPDVTAPAANRPLPRPQVTVAPEAMREFQRQTAEKEQGNAVAQANEVFAYQQDKKDAASGRRDERLADAAGGAVAAPPARARDVVIPESERAKLSESVDVVAEAPLIEARSAAVMAGKGEGSKRASAPAAPPAPPMTREERDRVGALGYVSPDIQPAKPVPQPQPRDMFFESKGTNPFVVTEEDAQATFGLDVDTASYTLTRNYLNRNTLPPAAAVRVEEFVNAFPNNVAPPRGNEESAFAVRVDGAPNPLHAGYHVLRVALRAKDVDPRERKAAHLTFVIDVSGSMAQESRLGLVKKSLALLVDKLDERDTIGIVVYGTTGRRVLAPTSASNRDRIMTAINRLQPEGSTNLEDGLNLGYEMAVEQFARGASNRVVLCTDGVANTGETEAEALLSRIRSEAKRGVDMMALGFGMGNYNDALLQRLADEGNGQYAYIDDLEEARGFFLRRLTSVLEVVARDAKAQVEFNPARVERYRLLGYEKRDVADRDFRNDSVDAGEINSGHSVTALFEVKLRPGSGKLGVARVRYKTGPRSEGVEFTRNIEDEAIARNFGSATPAFQTAYVAARFAEHLRKSYWVKDEALSALQPFADELETPQANELADLIRRASRLIRPAVREDW